MLCSALFASTGSTAIAHVPCTIMSPAVATTRAGVETFSIASSIAAVTSSNLEPTVTVPLRLVISLVATPAVAPDPSHPPNLPNMAVPHSLKFDLQSGFQSGNSTKGLPNCTACPAAGLQKLTMQLCTCWLCCAPVFENRSGTSE